MKNRFFMFAVIAMLAGSICLTSCVGSFRLHKKVADWNLSLTGNKFVNEVVYLALNIIPVYPIVYVIDALILNSIEFWTGNSLVAESVIKEMEGENGLMYSIAMTQNGYNVKCEDGQVMDFVYDKETNVWSLVIGESVTKLVKIEGESAIVYVNGEEKVISLTAEGVSAFRMEVANSRFFAVK